LTGRGGGRGLPGSTVGSQQIELARARELVNARGRACRPGCLVGAAKRHVIWPIACRITRRTAPRRRTTRDCATWSSVTEHGGTRPGGACSPPHHFGPPGYGHHCRRRIVADGRRGQRTRATGAVGTVVLVGNATTGAHHYLTRLPSEEPPAPRVARTWASSSDNSLPVAPHTMSSPTTKKGTAR
jgi:hypothetical protein